MLNTGDKQHVRGKTRQSEHRHFKESQNRDFMSSLTEFEKNNREEVVSELSLEWQVGFYGSKG
jgi:hypothetical protein